MSSPQKFSSRIMGGNKSNSNSNDIKKNLLTNNLSKIISSTLSSTHSSNASSPSTPMTLSPSSSTNSILGSKPKKSPTNVPKLDYVTPFEDPNIPMSPTDGSFSPCSLKMRTMRKNLSKSQESTRSQESGPKSFNLYSSFTKKDMPVSDDVTLILGSSSKNRREIFELNSWKFITMSPDIDEKAIRSTNLIELPQLIAKAKAKKLIDLLKKESSYMGNKQAILITTDQVVIYKGTLREKPVDDKEAKEFLASYSNEYVTTVSAVVATHLPSGRQSCDIDVAHVFWNEISPEIVNKVVAKGEIFSSAGGFRIEDPDLNPLIHDIDGALDSVVGMPIELTVRLIDIVLDEISYELNERGSQLFTRKQSFSHNETFEHFEDAWRDRRPSDSPYFVRRRAVKSWGRSRSGTSDTRSERSGSRARAFTGRSEGGLSLVQPLDFTFIPQSIPSSPTDRTLSPVSLQLIRRKSPVISFSKDSNSSRGDRGSDRGSEIRNSDCQLGKKRDYTLYGDVSRKSYPLLSPNTSLLLGTSFGMKRQVMDMLGWDYYSLNPTSTPTHEEIVSYLASSDPNSFSTSFTSSSVLDSPLAYTEAAARLKAENICEQLKEKSKSRLSLPSSASSMSSLLRDSRESLQENCRDVKYMPDDNCVIVTTYQVVMCFDEMRGVPKDKEEARKFLKSYSSQKVMTVTAVVATHFPSGRQASDTDICLIHFKDINADVIDSCVDRPEVLASVGAIHVEDPDLNPLILHIDGTIDSVVGLPVDMMIRLILNISSQPLISPKNSLKQMSSSSSVTSTSTNTTRDSSSTINTNSKPSLSSLSKPIGSNVSKSSVSKPLPLSSSAIGSATNSASTNSLRSSNSSHKLEAIVECVSSSANANNSQSPNSPDNSPPSPDSRVLQLECPGKRVAVRRAAGVKEEVLRYLSSGDKITVNKTTISGFYKIVDEEAFVNKNLLGVTWTEINE